MKPIYLQPDKYLLFVAMKEEPIESDKWIVAAMPPYLVDEICYVREAWKVDRIEDELVIRYKGDNAVIYIHESNDSDVLALIDRKRNPWSWRSPATMPQWASRRHVRIVSCEPMRVDRVSGLDAVATGHCQKRAEWILLHHGGYKKARQEFKAYWQSKHPDKQWAWRVITKEAPLS